MSINYPSIARKITLTLFAAQSLGSAGFIAASTINAIVGAELSHQPAWAGVPSGVYQIGGALAAFGWGYSMDRLGRRGGLTLGLLFGVLGAGIAECRRDCKIILAIPRRNDFDGRGKFRVATGALYRRRSSSARRTRSRDF